MTQTLSASQALDLAKGYYVSGDERPAIVILETVLKQAQSSSVKGQVYQIFSIIASMKSLWPNSLEFVRKSREFGIEDYNNQFIERYVQSYRSGSWIEINGRDIEFIHICCRIMGVDPGCPEYDCMLGIFLSERGYGREAVKCFEGAIEKKQDFICAHRLLSIELLRAGVIDRGGQEFNWWLTGSENLSHQLYSKSTIPKWNGESINHLLLIFIFGYGDTINFLRYIIAASKKARNITIACQPEMINLVRNSVRNIKAFDLDCNLFVPDSLSTDPDAFDAILCTDFLPWMYLKTHGQIEGIGNYIEPSEQAIERVAGLVQTAAIPNVGICWATGLALSDRSLPIDAFRFLWESGRPVNIFSLQQPSRTTDLQELADRRPHVRITDPGQAIWPFEDLAAFIRRLDLVVTIDTVTAHLAAAQGVPTWTALRYVADWRHFDDTDRSRWYPSMRLFRQARPGDVDSVTEAMRQAWLSFRPTRR